MMLLVRTEERVVLFRIRPADAEGEQSVALEEVGDISMKDTGGQSWADAALDPHVAKRVVVVTESGAVWAGALTEGVQLIVGEEKDTSSQIFRVGFSQQPDTLVAISARTAWIMSLVVSPKSARD